MKAKRKEGVSYYHNSTFKFNPEQALEKAKERQRRAAERAKIKESLRDKNPNQGVSPKNSGINRKSSPRKSRAGLLGHGRTVADKELHALIVKLGCFSCSHRGLAPISRICIHHPNGRNKGKPGDCNERFVFGLCLECHDPSTLTYPTDSNAPSVHGNKKAFIRSVGTESWCVYETYRKLGQCPAWLSHSEWNEYLLLCSQEEQEKHLINNPPARRAFV